MLTLSAYNQTVTARVIDSSTGEPLEFVNIWFINTPLGTVTDENGYFKIEIPEQLKSANVRISMISYIPQVFTVEELANKVNAINLIPSPTQLKEVVIKSTGKLKKVGNTDYSRIGNLCGWGGPHFGRGNEIGTKLELGSSPVSIRSLNIHVHRQAFDSSLYRLHIRNIADNLPFNDLLDKNIILTIKNESGWASIDLSKYNIILKGDIALTLEWVKAISPNKNREMKINKKATPEYVLFNTIKKKGCTYTRWGYESKWVANQEESPCFYLTIEE